MVPPRVIRRPDLDGVRRRVGRSDSEQRRRIEVMDATAASCAIGSVEYVSGLKIDQWTWSRLYNFGPRLVHRRRQRSWIQVYLNNFSGYCVK